VPSARPRRPPVLARHHRVPRGRLRLDGAQHRARGRARDRAPANVIQITITRGVVSCSPRSAAPGGPVDRAPHPHADPTLLPLSATTWGALLRRIAKQSADADHPPGSRPPVRHRRVWYGAAVLLVLAWLFGAGPLGAFMGRLTEVQTNDESSFLPASAESTEVSRIQQDFAQQERGPASIAHSADATLTGEQLAAIGDQVAAVRDRPEISDGEAVGPLVGTEDDSVAQVVVPLREDADVGDTVEELRALLAEHPVDGVEVYVAGPAGLVADLSAAFGGIDSTLLLVALGAVLVILISVYRSPILPVVVILAAMLALVLAAAAVYAAAAADWVQLNGQSQGILFILVVGACTDYALLLVSRYRETLQEHARPLDAMRTAVRGTV